MSFSPSTQGNIDGQETLDQLVSLVNQVKKNFHDVLHEWDDLKKVLCNTSMVQIPEADLSKLEKETRQLKQLTPKVLNKDYMKAYSILPTLQEDLNDAHRMLDQTSMEQQHWQRRCQTALADLDTCKQEKFGLKCDIEQMTQQLSQQSEYCARMGAAACTLLWRVSRCEESIQVILLGTQVDEFISLTQSTLLSYVSTYQQEAPQETTDETQFILALCGIFTNIAATPFGRDVLINNKSAEQLINTFFTVLSDAPNKHCAKMKNLVLMCLYNLSINQKGLKCISRRPELLELLAWLLREEKEPENCVNTLRLLQSLLYEQQNHVLTQEACCLLGQDDLLQKLTKNQCPDVREVATELRSDLQSMQGEQ